MLPPLAVVALALVAGSPLLDGRMSSGHDALEHVSRTAEYARAIASGVWWPHWAPNLGHGYGEPIFLFNPPLFYLLAGLPTLLGLPVVLAVNLATALLLVVAGLGVYAWARPVFGRPGAVVAAVAYVWAPYLLLDVHVRAALTELTGICLFPWALWGLARAARAPSPRTLGVAALAVAPALLGSTPATVVIAPALLAQIAVLADRRRPAGAVCALAGLGLGALLVSAFWLPASAERHLLRFDRLLVGPLAYTNHFLEPWQLVSSYWEYGNSRPGPDDRHGFGLGEAPLVLAACGLVLLIAGRGVAPMRRQLWLAAGLIVFGTALALEPASALWARLPALQYLQFPWRFLALPALGCALLAAAPAAILSRSHPRAAVLVAALCAAALVVGSWTRARPRELIAVSPDFFAPAAVAARDRDDGTAYEYETIWTRSRQSRPATDRLVVLAGSAEAAELPGSTQLQRFSVEVRDPARLRLQTFYFPGWRVYLDGQDWPIDYANRSGLIELMVEPGQYLLEARFEPTPPRRIGAGLSLLALGSVGLLLARPALAALRLSGGGRASRVLETGSRPAPLPPLGARASGPPR